MQDQLRLEYEHSNHSIKAQFRDPKEVLKEISAREEDLKEVSTEKTKSSVSTHFLRPELSLTGSTCRLTDHLLSPEASGVASDSLARPAQ